MKTSPADSILEGRFPGSGSMEEKIAFLLRYAVLAPSSHNSQPWAFSLEGNTVSIRADLRRWLRVADADQRELYVSLGCALENLLVAAEHFGFGHEVAFPADADRHGLAATVTLLAEGTPSTCRPAELFLGITRRATSRERYQRRPVAEEAVAELRECSVDDGVGLLLVADAALRARVRELVVQADRLLFGDRAWRRELGEWIGAGAFGDPPLRAKASQLAVSWLNLGRAIARHDARALDSAPVLGLLYSARDDRESQIRAGQAFERLALMATNRGLGVQPLSQLVELPEIRQELRALLPRPQAWPQHFFRLGHARRAARHSPRRPVEAALTPS